MKFLDATLATPAENLACDEALLDLCEEEGVETLRCWESRRPFVVVGYGNKVQSEVNVEECRRRAIPILRRCSGGGTVVQGPGCLNYNLTLRIPESGLLATVSGTNEFVMKRHRSALEELLGTPVAVKGFTDLAWRGVEKGGGLPTLNSALPWFKFSGNAQRRRRRALVFHGTILHAFDLALIDSLLRFPSAQPEYRASRSHAEFVRNISARPEDVKRALQRAWAAEPLVEQIPHARIHWLTESRYATDEWNLRR